MRIHSQPCSDDRLRALLDSDELSAEFEAISSHVDSCNRCQNRLSELAASDQQWDEARSLLTGSEADSAFDNEFRQSSMSVVASLSATCSGAETPTWTDAMVRQLLSPPSHPEMLGRLGRYEIERLVGSGGMGIVFKGFDTELNRPVAIKVLAPHLSGHGAARQRFAREARAAAAVVHEHVVAIHNVESEGTAPFLVMKFVAGESLQARIDRRGSLEICEILRIAHQTALGLAAAHSQGLVHRDVKPSNILLEQGVERALLTDFGLARASDDASLTHTGYMAGTPHYMSPEQARGDSVDARSDLFSLGSVIYTMATGRPPFRAETSFGILRRITDTAPRPIQEVNPRIPDWLESVVSRLHAKDPADRFSTAKEVAEILAQCLAHSQQPLVVPLPSGLLRGEDRNHVAEKFAGQLTARLRHLQKKWPMFLLAAALFTTALMIMRPDDRGPSTEKIQSEPSASQIDIPPAFLEWNGPAEQIDSWTLESLEFEKRAQQLWDTQTESVDDGQ